MSKKNRSKSLGRGLGAILGEVAEAYENDLQIDVDRSNDRIIDISLSDIVPNPYQPRKNFDKEAIKELGESIKSHGLLQPVVVIEHDGEYMLIAGERRVRASKEAGLDTIRAIVADIDKSRFRELALIENIQREGLNPIELAHSYKELIEEHEITQDDLSKMIHKSRAQIANTLRLLQLSSYVVDRIASAQITQGHAKVLVGLSEEDQKIVCDTIIGQKLNVRETEQLVSQMKAPAPKKVNEKKEPLFDLLSYAEVIKGHINANIRIKKDKIEIKINNEDELKDFLKKFA